MKQISCVAAATALCLASPVSASTCGTNKLCVPGDFPSPDGAWFNMDLLGGEVYLDGIASSGFMLENLQPITFHASPFANPTGSSVGTSTLSYAAIDHYSIATFWVAGAEASFYLDGTGNGELVDIDGSRGDWSLNIPLRATWNGLEFDFGTTLLTTAATYGYRTGGYPGTMTYLSGQSMDYASGDAFLVGQAEVNDTSHPFNGLRITLGLYGNDPVVSAVPEPTVTLQLLAGLGLVGLVARVRRPVRSPRTAA